MYLPGFQAPLNNSDNNSVFYSHIFFLKKNQFSSKISINILIATNLIKSHAATLASNANLKNKCSRNDTIRPHPVAPQYMTNEPTLLRI